MSRFSEGICPNCGGDFYTDPDGMLECDTCHITKNPYTGETVTESAAEED